MAGKNDMSQFSTAGRVSVLKPTAVNRVLQEVRQLEHEGRSFVSLMRGQPDSPTPAPIVEAAWEALRKGRTRYPDNRGEPALRRAVAQRLERDHGLSYDPDQEILITDGATGGLCAALGALLQLGDEVLLPDPIYDAYAGPIELWGGKPVAIPSSIFKGRFTFNRDAMEKAWSPHARLILINTPWNPTGTVLNRGELQAIVEFAAAKNLFLISDEIYETLVYDGKRHISPASLSAEARKRTLLVNSLSKTYAMTGWRVGYCAGPGWLIEAMLLLWQQSSRGPATFVQDAAICALSLGPDHFRDMAAEYQKRRNLVVSRLQGIPGVTPLVSEGGLFVMVDVCGLGKTSAEVRRYLLHKAGVVLIHGAAYGPGGEGTLRVSFAGGAILEEGLEKLRHGLLAMT
jgi:aspartate/methionine/tyrosine aminotransferase